MSSLIAFDTANRRVTSTPVAGVAGLYADLLSDTLYGITGATIVPLLRGSHGAAVYRTPVFVLDELPSFSCMRLEGPVVSAVAKIYGDGVLVHTTPAITGNDFVRVPARRCREWEIVVECDGRVTGVTLASAPAELL